MLLYRIRIATRITGIGLPILLALGALLLLFHSLRQPAPVYTDPIAPPEGWPKLILSTKSVTPTLATTSDATLWYQIEILNTGAYTALATSLVDVVPANVTYNGDAQASEGPNPTFTVDTLNWSSDVGFDSSVLISFSVDIDSGYTGTIVNSAVISHVSLLAPVTIEAATYITDAPVLRISKSAAPDPVPEGSELIYTILVENLGQLATNLVITDVIPAGTT